jgi:hypothetical protein
VAPDAGITHCGLLQPQQLGVLKLTQGGNVPPATADTRECRGKGGVAARGRLTAHVVCDSWRRQEISTPDASAGRALILDLVCVSAWMPGMCTCVDSTQTATFCKRFHSPYSPLIRRIVSKMECDESRVAALGAARTAVRRMMHTSCMQLQRPALQAVCAQNVEQMRLLQMQRPVNDSCSLFRAVLYVLRLLRGVLSRLALQVQRSVIVHNQQMQI